MSSIHRSPSESFGETVTWLCDLLGIDRRMATYIVWDVCITIGTDRHYWVDENRAKKYIENHTSIA